MAFCLVPDLIFPALTDVTAEALKQEKVAKFTEGKQIVKVIHVKNKLVNLIVK